MGAGVTFSVLFSVSSDSASLAESGACVGVGVIFAPGTGVDDTVFEGSVHDSKASLPV